jgi:hypothetical protein
MLLPKFLPNDTSFAIGDCEGEALFIVAPKARSPIRRALQMDVQADQDSIDAVIIQRYMYSINNIIMILFVCVNI